MDDKQLLNNEQRESTRFRRERHSEFVVIVFSDGDQLKAEVHDESLGGLGLYVPQDRGLAPGDEVIILYDGETFDAVVRHVQMGNADECLVGFSCSRSRGSSD